MTIDEITRAAAKSEMPEEPMTCPERCLYYTLNEMYRKYNLGKINKTVGEKLKNSAIMQFNRDVEELNSGKEALRRIGIFFRDIESAGSTYRLNPTIENADLFLETVYGCGRINK